MRSKRLFTSLSRGGLTQDASWTTRNKEWHNSTNQSFKQPRAGERLASSARHTMGMIARMQSVFVLNLRTQLTAKLTTRASGLAAMYSWATMKAADPGRAAAHRSRCVRMSAPTHTDCVLITAPHILSRPGVLVFL